MNIHPANGESSRRQLQGILASFGDTHIVIVDLPDAAVKESHDRVITAMINSGFKFPMGLTTINLALSDVRKEGPSFDLPIAVGILAANDQAELPQMAPAPT